MSDTMFEVNGKQISHKDLNVVRDFFTDEQWDLIDYALSEYQDHEDATEKCKETLDVIYQVFRSAYQEINNMSCLQNELLLESIFEEVQECFPYYDEEKQIEIAKKRFDDLCQ